MDKSVLCWRGQRVAQLERYASTTSALHRMSCRARTVCIVALAAVLTFDAPDLLAQDRSVHIYVTHLEADGMRFDSVDELREYLTRAPNDFFGVFVRECEATPRQSEVMRIVVDVLNARLAARGQRGTPVNLGMGSVPCP
jgi:hypothetical protein